MKIVFQLLIITFLAGCANTRNINTRMASDVENIANVGLVSSAFCTQDDRCYISKSDLTNLVASSLIYIIPVDSNTDRLSTVCRFDLSIYHNGVKTLNLKKLDNDKLYKNLNIIMKKITGLGEGDFIVYDNIVVDSNEGKFSMPPICLIVGKNIKSE